MRATVQQIICISFVGALLLIDSAFFMQRCSASPPINIPLLVFAAIVQASAVLLAYWSTYESPQTIPSLLRRPIFWLAVFLGIVSIPVAQYPLKYSDAIGRVNWFKSKGLECNLPNTSFNTAPLRVARTGRLRRPAG